MNITVILESINGTNYSHKLFILTLNFVTPSPTASMIPAPSPPGVYGS